MLSPADVKPLLVNEDAAVRWLALRYFVDSYSSDPEILPLAIRGGELSTDHDDYRRLNHIEHLAVSDEALEMVLARLNDSRHEHDVHVLERTLLAVPLAGLQQQMPKLAACARIDRRLMGRLKRRLNLSQKSTSELWAEFLTVADIRLEELSEQVLIHATDLIHVLAEREGEFWTEVEARIRANCESGREWLERVASTNGELVDEDRPPLPIDENLLLALIRLAGLGRREETAPAIFGLMELDGDYLLEACQEALCRIGSLPVARLAAERWSRLPDFLHIYLPRVLGAVKQPEAEDLLLAVLSQEPDLGHRTSLCEQLCINFSGRGLDVVGSQIEQGYDHMIADLVDDAVAVGRVLGLELPDLDRWRQARVKWEAKSFAAALRRKVELMAQQKGVDLDELLHSAGNATRLPQPVDSSSLVDDEWEPESITIRNEGSRTGRNEPCPCGSGKKYKKCCGSPAALRTDDF